MKQTRDTSTRLAAKPTTARSKTSYTVGRKAASGVFKSTPLPRGGEMRTLSRDVFEGAVKAAMRAKKPV
jgi:hypothetical protein